MPSIAATSECVTSAIFATGGGGLAARSLVSSADADFCAGKVARVKYLVATHGTYIFRIHRPCSERPPIAGDELDFVGRFASVDVDDGPDISLTESMLEI